jgi:hypothetical protein
MVIEYSKRAKGPYKAEAIGDYFKSVILDEMGTILKDIEFAFSN